MTAITFDTLASVRRLKAHGNIPEHAEAIADEIKAAYDVSRDGVVTREYLDLRLKELELRLQNQSKDLLIRIGGMIVALGGILIAIKYFG